MPTTVFSFIGIFLLAAVSLAFLVITEMQRRLLRKITQQVDQMAADSRALGSTLLTNHQIKSYREIVNEQYAQLSHSGLLSPAEYKLMIWQSEIALAIGTFQNRISRQLCDELDQHLANYAKAGSSTSKNFIKNYRCARQLYNDLAQSYARFQTEAERSRLLCKLYEISLQNIARTYDNILFEARN
ncbi:hypothetical protein IJ847_02265 [Candidatus Saccharibacteria bacterium]|nr:hypothetical protein [Candidatus Saccharibacteria bacterium]